MRSRLLLLQVLSMRTAGGLILIMTLCSPLAGCVLHAYKQPRESEPHAILTFEKSEGSGYRPWARKLNGGKRPDYPVWSRSALRIGVGTMRLEITDTPGEGTAFTSGPRFVCEVSFDAEAGRHYRVTSAWDDNGFLYVVTADAGAKVAECKGRERGEGAIVIQEAPVYRKANGTDVTGTLKRGDAVVAHSIGWEVVQFVETSGRVEIAFLDEAAGNPRAGWVRLADLATFTYFFCNYEVPASAGAPGNPFTSGKNTEWNVCFGEARDAKLKELRAAWADSPP